MSKFNQCLSDFLDILKTNYPTQKDTIDRYYSDLRKVEDEETKEEKYVCGDRYLEEFLENCRRKGDDISTKNEIIFSKDVVLLTCVDLHAVWNDEALTESQRENIWKYLHTLYLYAFEEQSDKDFKTILKELKKLSKKGLDSLNEDERTFMNIIDTISREKKVEKEMNNKDSDDDEDGEEGGAFEDIGADMKNLFESIQGQLFEGQIGILAKEIFDELDLKKLKIDDPVGFLKNILTGNINENDDSNGLSSIIKNITNKIKSKLDNGEIDKDKLFEETQSVVDKFQKMGFGDESEDENDGEGKKKKKKKKKKNPIMKMMANMMKQAGGKSAMDPSMMADMMKKMGGLGGIGKDKDGNPDIDVDAMTEMMSTMMKQMGGGNLGAMMSQMGGGRAANMSSTKERLKKKLAEKKDKK
jgi:formiminotetrahydrofolate cyclodeaminase